MQGKKYLKNRAHGDQGSNFFLMKVVLFFISPLLLGFLLASVNIIPIRFDNLYRAWVALDKSEDNIGYDFMQSISSDSDMVSAVILSKVADFNLASHVQYKYDETHIIAVDDVEGPKANAQDIFMIEQDGMAWFLYGHNETTNTYCQNGSLEWMQDKFQSIRPSSFETVPLNSRKSTADNLICLSEFVPVPMINIGNTCFMNSVLQALFQIRPIVLQTLLLACNNFQDKQNTLLFKLGFIFTSMANNTVNRAQLEEFIGILQAVFPDIRRGQQHDAEAFLLQLLLKLADELRGEANWKPCFLDDLIKIEREQSFVCDDITHPKMRTTRQPDVAIDLQLPALDGPDVNEISFDLLLDYSCADQANEGVYGHDGCGIRTVTKLKNLPPLLIVKLNRRMMNAAGADYRINKPVNFPYKGLDMTGYVDKDGVLEKESFVYDLVACINHTGTTRGGHYTTSIFKVNQGMPYSVLISDNEIIRNVTVRSQLEFSRKTAVVLFYIRRPQNCPEPVGFNEKADLQEAPVDNLFNYNRFLRSYDSLSFQTRPADRFSGFAMQSQGLMSGLKRKADIFPSAVLPNFTHSRIETQGNNQVTTDSTMQPSKRLKTSVSQPPPEKDEMSENIKAYFEAQAQSPFMFDAFDEEDALLYDGELEEDDYSLSQDEASNGDN